MANPLMSEWMYSKIWIDKNDSMTLEGAINKSYILVWTTILSAIFVWNNSPIFLPYTLPIVVIAFILSLVIIFNKKSAPYLAPVYAILEWIVIWAISIIYEKDFPGIVIQAVSLTFWVFLIMLTLYRTKIIKVTENLRTWIISATWAIALIYIISFLWSITGWYDIPYIHESWLIWIWFSVFIVWIASLNLVLDFDNIETWVKMEVPKYMEWYTSFWLLITLIWLYIEILRLLSKVRSR